MSRRDGEIPNTHDASAATTSLRRESFNGESIASLLLGDCVERMREIPDASVASVVTDPPYGLGFMGKQWDTPGSFFERKAEKRNHFDHVGGNHNPSNPKDATRTRLVEGRRYQEWCEQWAAECLRVLQPGGFILAFGGTRTYHRLTCAVEEAGFEIRDTIAWIYGQGFPKHHSLLKPALEPLVVARKTGRGWLNTAVCRLQPGDGGSREGEESAKRRYTERGSTDFAPLPGPRGGNVDGRWPANVMFDEEAAAMLDAQAGNRRSAYPNRPDLAAEKVGRPTRENGVTSIPQNVTGLSYSDSGGASRFFFVPKATPAERNEGLTVPSLWTADAPEKNDHPTVKPIALIRWLVRLATPAGGIVLDPFLGSGTTAIAAALEGFQWIGIERDPDYMRIAEARISYWTTESVEATA